jgi:hypothetical protein
MKLDLRFKLDGYVVAEQRLAAATAFEAFVPGVAAGPQVVAVEARGVALASRARTGPAHQRRRERRTPKRGVYGAKLAVTTELNTRPTRARPPDSPITHKLFLLGARCVQGHDTVWVRIATRTGGARHGKLRHTLQSG